MEIKRCQAAATAALLAAVLASGAAQGAGQLAGTSWKLVRYEDSNGTIWKPKDPAKYTIAFGRDGRLSARIDCNRGSATWKTDGRANLALGPLALTRAKCPAPSIHDRMVKDWKYLRSYSIRNGRLLLLLMLDAGAYEFEPG